LFHWYDIGAVPEAVTLNVAVWPATIFTLAGCEEIVGATGSFVEDTPVPFKATEMIEPVDRVNSKVP
jgi:hypothetical protein